MDDEALMDLALDEARLAAADGEVPIGAVVVVDGEVVARRHNEREATGDPTAHAEVLALRDAAESVGSWRLEGATLVVTLEPCPMCAGAIVQARVPQVVYGCTDPKAGACHTLYQITEDDRLNHRCQVLGGARAVVRRGQEQEQGQAQEGKEGPPQEPAQIDATVKLLTVAGLDDAFLRFFARLRGKIPAMSRSSVPKRGRMLHKEADVFDWSSLVVLPGGCRPCNPHAGLGDRARRREPGPGCRRTGRSLRG